MVGERPQRAVERKETYSIYLWRFAKKGIVPVPVPLNKTFACERDFRGQANTAIRGNGLKTCFILELSTNS